MLFITFFTLLLSAVTLAAPAAFKVRDGTSCAPTAYTLSDFALSISETTASVDFNFKSTFANVVDIDDVVMSGADCHVDGASMPNNNECDVEKRKLLFDLAGPQDTAHYHITHTWVCDGATWMSGNDVIVKAQCNKDNDVTTCIASPQTVVPQNVRQICSTPTC